MKKKSMSRALSMLMAVIVALGMLCINAVEANADNEWYVSMPEVLWMNNTRTTEGNAIGVWKEDKKALVTSVTPASSKIVEVVKVKGENEKGKKQNYFYIVPKAVGKTKVTVQYKLPSGTKKKSTKTVTVKKYPNHIKSLKVNGKKVTISKHKFRYDKGKIKKTKIPIELKLKKGWKVVDAWGSVWNNNNSLEIKKAKSKLKNGTAISWPKKYTEFELMITMSDGTDYIDYHIRLSRNENP